MKSIVTTWTIGIAAGVIMFGMIKLIIRAIASVVYGIAYAVRRVRAWGKRKLSERADRLVAKAAAEHVPSEREAAALNNIVLMTSAK